LKNESRTAFHDRIRTFWRTKTDLTESYELNQQTARRYSRQMMLPQIGEGGQRRLAAAKVLLVGLGGLGSLSAYYLAAAGVGRLKMVDCDRVALENLNRQILHATTDIGRDKIASAGERLAALNPDCRIDATCRRVDEAGAHSLAAGCDVIVDATDNRSTRLALNRASLIHGVPFVYGGIDGWNGSAAVFLPGKTACLACLVNPLHPVGKTGRRPALGPTAGLVASIQCLQTLTILLGDHPPLAGCMLDIQGREMRFRAVAVERNPDCHCCSRPHESRIAPDSKNQS
jgi:adenylyltransferase/sulfurtransferase